MVEELRCGGYEPHRQVAYCTRKLMKGDRNRCGVVGVMVNFRIILVVVKVNG